MSKYKDEFTYATIEIRTSGVCVIHRQRMDELTLDYLHPAVDGPITITNVIYPDKNLGYKIIANDDGYARELPINLIATTIAGQVILGNVVIALQQGPEVGKEPDVYAMPIAEAHKLRDVMLNYFYAAVAND